MANLTRDKISVVDDSTNNSIQINTDNLGKGDYEFRLLDTNSNAVKSYQDQPLFENLNGSVYTIEANDKNNCGAVLLKVSLLSFPKFFTPNDDSINDFWQIKGFSNQFYSRGFITIFDRYGSSVGKINMNNSGWDGRFNEKKCLQTIIGLLQV